MVLNEATLWITAVFCITRVYINEFNGEPRSMLSEPKFGRISNFQLYSNGFLKPYLIFGCMCREYCNPTGLDICASQLQFFMLYFFWKIKSFSLSILHRPSYWEIYLFIFNCCPTMTTLTSLLLIPWTYLVENYDICSLPWINLAWTRA